MNLQLPKILLCSFAASLLCTALVGAQDSAVERGRTLYYEHGCYGCHGFNGETGARDLVGTGSPVVENADLFLAFLRARADQAPLLPTTRMPNYPENALSDAEARDIFAFVDSFVLDAPETDSVPIFGTILELAERPYEGVGTQNIE